MAIDYPTTLNDHDLLKGYIEIDATIATAPIPAGAYDWRFDQGCRSRVGRPSPESPKTKGETWTG
jgi:hypothetical protein